MTLTYTPNCFKIFSPTKISKFDSLLLESWKRVHDNGRLLYKTPAVANMKPLRSGDFSSFVLVLPDRFYLRRKPVEVNTLNDPFPKNGFNFTKVPEEEILFRLQRRFDNNENTTWIIANISPFATLHSLLVPEPDRYMNQRLCKLSIRLAVECMLLSENPLLCLAFNSLLAHASVNHLHFHLWQSSHQLFATTSPTRHKPFLLKVLELTNHPVDNFVFELTSLSDLDGFVDRIWSVIQVLQRLEVAHNLFASRGVSSSDGKEACLRVVVWARRSISTTKLVGCDLKSMPSSTNLQPVSLIGLNIAVVELAGMLLVADQALADEITGDQLLQLLRAEVISDEAREQIINQLRNEEAFK